MASDDSGDVPRPPGRVLKNILLLESIAEEAHRWLEGHANVLVAASPSGGVALAEQLPIHGIVTRGKGEVDAGLIAACRDLEVIARCGVGLDNIDVDAATACRVRVVNAPGSNADTVAEHTLALMLMLQRDMVRSVLATRNGDWNFRNRYAGDELRGKTLGILGLGDIGGRVARLAAAFGMDVVYWGRTELPGAPYAFRALDEIWETADVISVHLPLVPGTRHLLDRAAFARMRRRPLIINTARGAIIAQDALAGALTEGRIGGFAADVLTVEPPTAEDPLLAMENVLITPHSASLTATTYGEVCMLIARNIVALLRGEDIDPKFVFNRDRL